METLSDVQHQNGNPGNESVLGQYQQEDSRKVSTKDEQSVFKKLVSCLKKLAADPRYPSLKSHEIEALTRRYGIKVWESYLENKNSGAMRIFWVYGPNQQDITIIGLEPHPNDKKDAYDKITLSSM